MNDLQNMECSLQESVGEEREKEEDPAASDFNVILLERLNLGPKKKLLVLSLNGLLLYRAFCFGFKGIPKNRHSDDRCDNFLFYKRPYAKEFIKFCLQRFQVGIWSSATKRNAAEAVEFALGELTYKLLFIWNRNDCTDSKFKSLENNNKPLLLKELKKISEEVDQGGPYNEANTLLIDTHPYRGLFNPPHTGIYPKPYNPEDKDDNTLDPNGELGLYVKGLADANEVQSYVRDHSFGQPAITSSHPNWNYYSLVLRNRDTRTCTYKKREKTSVNSRYMRYV